MAPSTPKIRIFTAYTTSWRKNNQDFLKKRSRGFERGLSPVGERGRGGCVGRGCNIVSGANTYR